jgi:hypothetical protein
VVNESVMNRLILKGGFSANDIHNWLGGILPDMPPLNEEEDMKLAFKSIFVGSVLVCEYKSKAAKFWSDSITTIAIIKDMLNQEANMRSIDMEP